MGPPAVRPAVRLAVGRLAGVGAVVFLANAGLLVLQLAAGRLLAPFVGSSLETWTAVIGAFLAGIALGNWAGGRTADRSPAAWKLAAFLALGGVAAGWMILLPGWLTDSHAHRYLPLSVRIPVLAAVLCLPAGFALSLLTPLAVRLATADVRSAGRVAGTVFALSTLGCLAGNYLTGFYLIPAMTVNMLVGATGTSLVLAGVLTLAVTRWQTRPSVAAPSPAAGSAAHCHLATSPPRLSLRRACVVVFLCSFAGMTLELAAARLLAPVVGVSLFTWTGVIGVMLAGTAAGNWAGGRLGDRAGAESRFPLAACLVAAAAAGVFVLLAFFTAQSPAVRGTGSEAGWVVHALYHSDLILRVLLWTFLLFLPAMFFLGTVSPQVIRLAVPDVAHAGRVAGRVYAWSTAGAIAGTFAAGFVLMSAFGVYRTVLLAAGLPAVAAVLVARVWERNALLYPLSLVAGAVVFGFTLIPQMNAGVVRDTNYYTIQVLADETDPDVRKLQLDALLHSVVKKSDPLFLHYQHERIHLELLRTAALAHPAGPRVLVIGGGGYTFPRAGKTAVPNCAMDVVEIDPGVTAVSYQYLFLDPAMGIRSFHMDGRQFVSEKAPPGHYHLITLDAVNDLTVPAHLLTAEFAKEVRTALTPDGVYVLTVIDRLTDGRLWRAAVHTLRKEFPHVELLSADPQFDPDGQAVYVIYAASTPFDPGKLRAALAAGGGGTTPATHRPADAADIDRLLGALPPVVLTDQFAPVDNMMADVFRRRKQ
jgi:spermidine synthase/MFS family permease